MTTTLEHRYESGQTFVGVRVQSSRFCAFVFEDGGVRISFYLSLPLSDYSFCHRYKEAFDRVMSSQDTNLLYLVLLSSRRALCGSGKSDTFDILLRKHDAARVALQTYYRDSRDDERLKSSLIRFRDRYGLGDYMICRSYVGLFSSCDNTHILHFFPTDTKQ